MICVVCEAQQRDLNDIERRMAELAVDQKRARTVSECDYIQLSIKALAAAKARFEGQYLKHKKSEH